MNDFWAICFRQSWQLVLLIPVLILIARCFGRHSRIAYAILLLGLLKCVVPPLWGSSIGVFSRLERPVSEQVSHLLSSGSDKSIATAESQFETRQRTDADSLEMTETPVIGKTELRTLSKNHVDAESHRQTSTETVASAPPVGSANPARALGTSGISTFGLLLIAWLTGAVALFGYLVGKRIQMARFHADLKVAPSDDLLELLEYVSAQLEIVQTPRLLVTQHPTVPYALGVLRPAVVLPKDVVSSSSPEQLRFILAHELTHFRRGDMFVSLVQQFVQLVWWWHPAVWWLNQEIRRVREQCVDAEVIERLSCPPGDYARCLLAMVEWRQRLRIAPELPGLSPFEVTRQRLEYVMRLPAGGAPQLHRVAVTLTAVPLALVILPGAAHSPPAPVVASQGNVATTSLLPIPSSLDEELQAVSPAIDAEQYAPSPDKAGEADALEGSASVSEEESGESDDRQTTQSAFPMPADPPPIHEPNTHVSQLLQYQMTLRLETSPTPSVYEGIARFHITPLESEPGAPDWPQHDFLETGSAIPTLRGRFEPPSPMFRMGPRLATPTTTSTDHPASQTAQVLPTPPRFGGDYLGYEVRVVNDLKETLPPLFGTATDFVLPGLKSSLTGEHHTQYTQTLDLPIRDGSDPTLTRTATEPLTIEVNSIVAIASEHQTRPILRRSWTLQTKERVDGHPRRAMQLSGNFELNESSLLPDSVEYVGSLSSFDPGSQTLIPVRLEFVLLSSEAE